MYHNPYQDLDNGRWMKSNFHTHAGTGYRTCGTNRAEETSELYRAAGYQFLTISNHNLFTDTSPLSDEKLLMIKGVEYTQEAHMLNIGCNASYHEDDYQTAIDKTAADGGFSVMCHPNWIRKEFWTWKQLLELKGYCGIEVYNGVIYRLTGSGLAADTWDHLLSNGRMVFGFGSDDTHAYFDIGRAYNLIYCREQTWEAMNAAIQSGQFCASTGLKPVYCKLEGDVLKVKAEFVTSTYVDTFTYRFITENGKLLSTQVGSAAEYRLSGEKYVRVEVMGENGALLFFQPIYRTDAFGG